MISACEPVRFDVLEPAKTQAEYDLHVAAVEWDLEEPIIISGPQDIKSAGKWRNGFKPFRHQVQNLITFCRRLPVTLLADDVGLGKTISAGMILSELAERRAISRALVVCPANIGNQWVHELEHNFGIRAEFVFGGAKLADRLTHSDTPVVITTYATASKRIADIPAGRFDMLILDEAHKLRNLHGPGAPAGEGHVAQKVRQALANRTFKYVLMMTATPIQNRVWDLYSLIDLLSVAKGRVNPFGQRDAFQSRYLESGNGRKLRPDNASAFRDIVQQFIQRTRHEEALLSFPKRIVTTRRLTATAVEHRMVEIVRTEIEKVSKLVQISLGQAMMSSPQALARQLENMTATTGTLSPAAVIEMRRLADSNPVTAKLAALLELTRELKQQRPLDWRLVIFTLRKETQDAIGRTLEKAGYEVDYVRGGSTLPNDLAKKRFNADPPEINILISTDAGAEGANLQSGNVMVNYDLPWNPMILEQRIGRIQRLNSKHKHVVIFHLVIKASVEDLVVGRLLEKLQAVKETVGDIEAILDAAGDDDEGSFEEMMRRLVLEGLKEHDVNRELELKEQSYEKAKTLLGEARENLNSLFSPAPGESKHEVRLPSLNPVKRSLDVPAFVGQALAAEGATLRPLANDIIEVLQPGRASHRITFNAEIAAEAARGVSGGGLITLYEPRTPAFETLVRRWVERAGHCVKCVPIEHHDDVHVTARDWCATVPDAVFTSQTTLVQRQRLDGSATCRVRAANGVDRFEKILEIKLADAPSSITAFAYQTLPFQDGPISATAFSDDLGEVISSAALGDRDVQQFCEFYEALRQSEGGKAIGNERRLSKLDTDLLPKVVAAVVGLHGISFEVTRCAVSFTLGSPRSYQVELEFVTATGQILTEPERARCEMTGRELPLACLARSTVSGRLATAHLLAPSVRSGLLAFPTELVACEETGAMLLPGECGICAVSGKRVDSALLLTSDFSRARVLPQFAVVSPTTGLKCTRVEAKRCTWTGALLTPDDVHICKLTGLPFSAPLLNPAGYFSILCELLDGNQTVADATIQSWVASELRRPASQIKSSQSLTSPDGNSVAMCVEVRTLLGFKVRFLGALAATQERVHVIGNIVEGTRKSGRTAGAGPKLKVTWIDDLRIIDRRPGES